MNEPTSNVAGLEFARLRIAVQGAVQGVGFRPFVYRLASELGLNGWVNNSSQGVFIEVEGERDSLNQFLIRLESQKPPRSFIQSLESSWLDAVGYDGFVIRDSVANGSKTALVLPDIATCPDCLREIFDPTNRRFGYPFTNCTNCGPRFSIIEDLPYDRSNTSMKSFRMCPECQAEYNDPQHRRFHAQPNACPVCGPQIELWPGNASSLSDGEKPRILAAANDALLAAAHIIRCGQIVAMKGIGGFHLLVDARNEAAVRRLRERKHREEKPFALIFPSLESVKSVCKLSLFEERLLRSPEAPIVLLHELPNCQLPIADSVAPNNPNLGVMLPSNPLHHLLMMELGFPVVATSGNLSDEPICTDEYEALDRLNGIADVLLAHNRPIVRHIDDSIVRVIMDREMILRRARGYAPLPITLKPEIESRESVVVLAVGAHQKNSAALAVGEQVFISQHIGDLETEQANRAFHRVVGELPRLYDAAPETIAADLHPDYVSTQFARESGNRVIGVQHHIAHSLSCIAENEVELPALGVAWDGTGLGLDGTIWGGEFFLVTHEQVERVAHLRPFHLPGGDKAVKEPRRAATGFLFEMLGEAAFERDELHSIAAFSHIELSAIKAMLQRNLNSTKCCSIGRLFDAVASLINIRQNIKFEGQAAMELEFALEGINTDECYPMSLATSRRPYVLDWSPMIEAIIRDVKSGEKAGMISAKFHNTLVEAIIAVANQLGEHRVALSGGCFQNRYLAERTIKRLRDEGFIPYWHQRVPTNDGGIALGQVVGARRSVAVCNSTGRSTPEIQPVHNRIKLCGWSDGHSRAPMQPITHHASH